MRRGVILGKFYPPHKGHHFLIETGLANCDQLTVIVCELSEHKIKGKTRAAWLKEVHPKAKVLVKNYDNVDPFNSKLWAKLTIEWLGYKPDVAFTSEEYGHNWCKEMGCEHHLVDIDRVKIPMSGTKVRENPYLNWDFIKEPVKEFFAKRIIIVGAESTGTTTLTRELSKHYKTTWAPEYGRMYSEAILSKYKWKTSDFVHIAKMQNLIEDRMARKSNKLVIGDTDSFATHIWHKRYLGKYSRRVKRLSRNRKVDLYIVTDVDIPFVQDGIRDGEHIREWMHREFIKKLTKEGKPFMVVSGTREERLNKAIKKIDELLKVSEW